MLSAQCHGAFDRPLTFHLQRGKAPGPDVALNKYLMDPYRKTRAGLLKQEEDIQ